MTLKELLLCLLLLVLGAIVIGLRYLHAKRDGERRDIRLARRLLTHNLLNNYIPMENDTAIKKIKVSKPLWGISIEKLCLQKVYKLKVIAVENENKIYMEVRPDYILFPGDVLVVFGKRHKIRAFETFLLSGHLPQTIKKSPAKEKE